MFADAGGFGCCAVVLDIAKKVFFLSVVEIGDALSFQALRVFDWKFEVDFHTLSPITILDTMFEPYVVDFGSLRRHNLRGERQYWNQKYGKLVFHIWQLVIMWFVIDCFYFIDKDKSIFPKNG